MAAGEGFEPSHTESESAVLPLHNPAKRKAIIHAFWDLSRVNFAIFTAIFTGIAKSYQRRGKRQARGRRQGNN